MESTLQRGAVSSSTPFSHTLRRSFSVESAPERKVAVLGAAGGIGQPLVLLMKLNPLVSCLALYDIAGTPGVATDVSHINTRAEVKGYMVEEQLGQPQEELLRSKPAVTALIDELEKLHSPRRLPAESGAPPPPDLGEPAAAKKPYLRLPRPPLQASPPPSSVPRRPVTRRRLSETFPALDLYYAMHRSYDISVVRCSMPLASSPPMDILNRQRRSSPLP